MTDADKLNRKQRKQIERQRELEKRKLEKEQEESDEKEEVEENAGEDGNKLSSTLDKGANAQVWGLESEMKLNALQSKQAKRRMKKKMKEQ